MIYMREFIEKHALLIVFIIFIFALILRSANLWNNILFTFDQGRDAQRIAGIVSLKDFKLVGPETDIPGVFNGPLFYYLLAPVYAVANFNPNFVALFILFINNFSIFILYYLSQILFKNRTVGIIAAFLLAISYEQANYARHISNASLMEISALIFFLGLALYFIKDKKLGLPLSIIGFSLGVQFNFYLIYLAIFYPLCFMLFKKKSIDIKNIIISAGLLILFFLPFGITELKWHFMATRSLLSFATGQSTLLTMGEAFSKYFQSFAGPIYNSIFSFNLFIGFLITLGLIVYSYFIVKDKKVLLFFYLCLFSTLPLFGFNTGVLQGEVINSPILPFYTLLYALGITWLFKSRDYKLLGIIILALIILSNATLFVRNNFINVTVFDPHDPLLLRDEQDVIDYTYQSEHGKPFSICAVTNPLFINALWSYLYNWYGLSKYGYLPFWSGQPQYFTKNLLPYDINHVEDRYLIIEPTGGLPAKALSSTIYLEDNTSKLDEVRQFGSIVVQKRTLQTEPRVFMDTQGLTKSEIANLKVFINGEPRYTCFTTYSQKQ